MERIAQLEQELEECHVARLRELERAAQSRDSIVALRDKLRQLKNERAALREEVGMLKETMVGALTLLVSLQGQKGVST